MKIMLDFNCAVCGSFERYVESDTKIVDCDCGAFAARQLSMPTVKLEGLTGDFPGAHEKWARIREDNARIKAKRNS